ncbi:MAG: hypothetical protein KJO98_12775 [Rhodothermia bacterium]|nr:hypothetical protein [Rhodothermia bacterium]
MWIRACKFLLVVALLAAPAMASFGQISVEGSLANDRDANPGEVYAAEIVVRNDTDEATQARIYQTDYLFFHDGSNYFEDPGTTPRSNAGWVQFNPSSLTIPAGGHEVVSFVVTVPEQVDGERPDGSYWSMLMVEGIPKDSPQSTLGDADQPTFGIRQVTRYGVQIATHIRGAERYSIEIQEVALREDAGGQKVLELSFENNGNLLLIPDTWVELYDDSGEMSGRVEGSQSRVYPGTSVAHRFDLSSTPGGIYEALIVVDGGEDNIFGAQYKVNL